MSILRALIRWAVGALLPIALIGLGVQLLLTPLYLQLEYRLPGFPADEYGFSTEERLHWGTYGINYLRNGEGPSYLGELRFSDGGPVFTAREVAHMHDVKSVVSSLLRLWYFVVALLLGFGFWAGRGNWITDYLSGLRLGGWVTLGLAGMAGAIGTLGASGSGDLFWEFFSGFHGLFFGGDSWLFAYSDTLIRLYPIRFWQDCVLYIGFLAALAAAALVVGGRVRASKPPTAA